MNNHPELDPFNDKISTFRGKCLEAFSFYGWLSRSSEEAINKGKGEAYCKVCHAHLRAHKTDLVKHTKTDTHVAKTKGLKDLEEKRQPKLTSFGITEASNSEKETDIDLSVFIASHSAILTIDHLGELLRKRGKGSCLENLQLHRTKCSSIIMHVVSPVIERIIIDEIGEAAYSIIIDESTDISCEKYAAYCVRYYNSKLDKITVDFLGFQEVYRATAEALYENFKIFLQEVGLKFEKMIGLGTDGGANFCGVNRSLYTLLKAEKPDLLLFKCMCHSLALCAAKAAEQLPATLEYLLRETRSWFCHSTLRQKVYHEVYATLEGGKKPLKLTKLAATRWLSFYTAVNINIKQWLPLKTFFNMVVADEKCYKARELKGMYNDDQNLLYLLFIAPILKAVTDLNIAFQASDANVSHLYDDLLTLILCCAKRIFSPSYLRNSDLGSIKFAISKAYAEIGNSLLPQNSVDYGEKFDNLAAKKTVDSNVLKDVKSRCVKFLVVLCEQLLNRLPENFDEIKKIRNFSPAIICSQSSIVKVSELPWLLAGTDTSTINREAVEEQLRLLRSVNIGQLLGDLNINLNQIYISHFWCKLLKTQNAGGQPMFKDLAEFALRALSIPVSNAVVERVFSVMNAVKTKPRNKIKLNMLVAILRIRLYMFARDMCCRDFKVTDSMISLHNSANLYSRKSHCPGAASTSQGSSANDDGGLFETMNFLQEDDDDMI